MRNISKIGCFLGITVTFSGLASTSGAQIYPNQIHKTNHFATQSVVNFNHNQPHPPQIISTNYDHRISQSYHGQAYQGQTTYGNHASTPYRVTPHYIANQGYTNTSPAQQNPALMARQQAKKATKLQKNARKKAKRYAKQMAKMQNRQQHYTGQSQYTRQGQGQGAGFGSGLYTQGKSAITKNGRYASVMDRLSGRRVLQAQPYAAAPGPFDQFQQWVDFEPQYKLYPGDQVDIVVQSAPELSRTLTVGPDGRITMPMASPIMAAGKTLPFLQNTIQAAMAKQLKDPTLTVTSRSYSPQQIYVGGQVGQQGTYTMSGPIGSLEAIIMAGGFLPSAKSKNVAILRRAPNGSWMLRTINHKQGLNNVRSYADNMQLKRGDVVFIPRNTLSEVGNFMSAFRQALPVDMSLTYNIGNGSGSF